MKDQQAHVAFMAAVAKHFYSEPNAKLSKDGVELRFGTHGSPKKGVLVRPRSRKRRRAD
jgi:hypothetical protein